MAEHVAHVILAVRNVDAGRTAAAGIKGSTVVAHLDLASLESVHQFAAGIEGPVDLLVNNAGVLPRRPGGQPSTGSSCSSPRTTSTTSR